MKLLNDINIVVSNNFIELMALKAESDGMLSENYQRMALSQSMAYAEKDFLYVADRMRALKYDEAKPEQPTTTQGQNAQSGASALRKRCKK
jgi:hypothetical protein